MNFEVNKQEKKPYIHPEMPRHIYERVKIEAIEKIKNDEVPNEIKGRVVSILDDEDFIKEATASWADLLIKTSNPSEQEDKLAEGLKMRAVDKIRKENI